jgi:hypothetical protein
MMSGVMMCPFADWCILICYAECNYAGVVMMVIMLHCRVFLVMLSAIMLNVVRLNVIMLNVIMMSIIMLNVARMSVMAQSFK